MTHPTKAVFKLLLADYVKVSHHAEDMLYDEKDLQACLDKIERINYHEELNVNGIKFRCYNAGHVLGAAMFMFDIAGVKVLYTGDFSKHDDRHLVGAEVPSYSPDVLIVESTYGIQIHEERVKRESRFTQFVHRTVSQGGRCLIPVFALGRAQELLLILEEYWNEHPELQTVPIYYASSLAKRCMTIFQTYINMMNKKIQREYEVSNPFVFKHIHNLKSAEHLNDSGPVVVMASPAMLQSGLSRQLFEKWASDSKNGIIIPGYCVEGTLAKTIMSTPPTITTTNGIEIPFRMPVEYTSFSAHSDYAQTSEFIRDTKPKYIVLVHGDPQEMQRLKSKLTEEHADRIQIFTPRNCETVELKFQGEKMAKIVGALASEKLKDGDVVTGMLISKDFDHSVISADDLMKFTDLTTHTITQRQLLPFRNTFGLLVHLIEQVYENRKVYRERLTIVVHGLVTLTVIKHDSLNKQEYRASGDVLSIEWNSEPVSDMIADSLLTLILQMESNPAILHTQPQDESNHEEFENIDIILRLLKHRFTQVEFDTDSNEFRLTVDNVSAVINHRTKEITCENKDIHDQLKGILRRIEKALYPLE
eukprot:c9019_g1_i2.p1 GENE.c9019_g1_i2~~c9019_g1_i2.p1  ORF type:complete len:590 (+),score=123.04 c9019_g1_i2:386-2155(+)